jgi:isopenicillin-N epimerase
VRVKLATLTRPRPSAFRRHWALKPGIVFLNHGSFGACPKAVLQRQAVLRRQMEAEPVQFLWRRYEERLEPARAELARFVGARSRDLVFVTNATTAVNAISRSMPLRRGDEVLTTNLDYNACRNVLVEAVRRAEAKLVVASVPFPLRSGDQVMEAVMEAVTPRTRLAMIDHVTSDTALVLPLSRIIRELEGRGVDVLVDGAHAPGMLPIDLKKLRPAYYTGNLHKWVCAPKGAAFLWVREDKQADLQPPVISHGNNRRRRGFTEFQDRFDWVGTSDPTAWFCVGEAIRWMESLFPGGWPELRRRNHDLAVQAQRLLSERFEVERPCPEEMLGSMATVPLPHRFQGRPAAGKIDAEQLQLYDRFGIEVPFNRVGRPLLRCLRISAQVYNQPAEYKYLADALELLGGKGKAPRGATGGTA